MFSLKLGESIYVAMDLIPILLGSLPLAHNAQHSLVYLCIYPVSVYRVLFSNRRTLLRLREKFKAESRRSHGHAYS